MLTGMMAKIEGRDTKGDKDKEEVRAEECERGSNCVFQCVPGEDVCASGTGLGVEWRQRRCGSRCGSSGSRTRCWAMRTAIEDPYRRSSGEEWKCPSGYANCQTR